jgi:hypothetical protein
MRKARYRLVVLAALLAVPVGCVRTTAPAATWATLATTDGATLARLSLPDGSHAYLQRIDVRRMRIEQVLGERDATQPAAGSYYPGAGSPRFTRITTGQVERDCRARFGATLFSAVNFAFFEEYDRSTRLSFPAKSHGTVLSGGSSGYGPVASPRADYYRGVTLKALAWTDQRVAVGSYDPATGAPLDAATDALVTYRYQDHPARALNADPPNRYQLLGTEGADHLLLLTVEHTTLDAAADLLRRRGATGDVLTFDGGVSTYLWQGSLGPLVPVTNQDGALPHYLCIHAAPVTATASAGR